MEMCARRQVIRAQSVQIVYSPVRRAQLSAAHLLKNIAIAALGTREHPLERLRTGNSSMLETKARATFVTVVVMCFSMLLLREAESEVLPQDASTTFDADLLEAARAHDLPHQFFARLIWQESRFKPYAVSPAGAQGIAQFMPGTAQWRGLADPFNPAEALNESARWLGELRRQFGNLGLAAAAYNAGPGRVSRWLAGRSDLPNETRSYVKIITGESAERWSECTEDIARPQTCPEIPPHARHRARLPDNASASTETDLGARGAWGLQLAGDRSLARVLADFSELQRRFWGVLGDRKPLILRSRIGGKGAATWYRVRVAESTRERATELCARLERAGGSCIVQRN